MKFITGGLAVTVALVGVAIGLAGPASAESLNGSYHGLLIDGGGQVLNDKPVSLSFAPCGADCTRMKAPGREIDLRLQNGSWVVNYDWQGTACTTTVDANATVLDDICPGDQPMRLALTKIG